MLREGSHNEDITPRKGLLQKSVGLATTAVLLGAILAGCGTGAGTNSTGSAGQGSASNAGSTAASGQVIQGGTITIDEPDDMAHLDPALADDLGDWEVVPQEFYNQLITYKAGSNDLVPDIATDWSVSRDGRTYTFHLRKDVTFWNGDKVTAQSFIDEFKRVLTSSIGSPAEGYINPVVVGSEAFTKGQAKDISGITAPDPYTLVIKLNNPEAFFLDIIALPFFSPVDQAYIDKIGNAQFDHQPMGTGPFMLKSYTRTKEMVLVKNPSYYDKNRPKLDEIDIDIVSNPQISMMRFQQGTTAFMSWNQSIPSNNFVQMINDPKYKNYWYKMNYAGVYYLAMNNNWGPLKNKLVRQAINYAINKNQLVKLQNGRAMTTSQILPQTYTSYNKNLPADLQYNYNMDKAKQLLAQAGYANGFSVTALTPNDEESLKVMQSIQSDLQNVGIKMTLKPEGTSAYLDMAASGKEQMVYASWYQAFPDPYEFLDILLNGNEIPQNNYSAYNNPTVNQEFAAAAAMPQGPSRDAKYQDIQNQILADAPVVPLFDPVVYALVQPWVKGFYFNTVLQDPLQDLYTVKH